MEAFTRQIIRRLAHSQNERSHSALMTFLSSAFVIPVHLELAISTMDVAYAEVLASSPNIYEIISFIRSHAILYCMPRGNPNSLCYMDVEAKLV